MKKQWLLLIPGIVLLYFSNGRFGTPVAAWLFPLFFLQVSRNPAFKFSGIIFPLVVAATLQASFLNFTSHNVDSLLFYIPFFAGLVFGFLFFADRLCIKRNTGFAGTLFFPLLYTTVDFLNSLLNSFGTTGILGYSQLGFLPFAQLAAITGMWGLTFMITWFSSVVVWALNNPWQLSKKGVLIYTAILSAVLLFGSIRVLVPLKGETVKVAGIHTTDKERDGKAFWAALAQKDTAGFNNASRNQIQKLVSATKEQAKNGAKIILWSEVSPTILKDNEEKLLLQLKTLAKELSIYLVANPYVATTDTAKPENKIWMFSPDGELLLTHYKYGGNFLEGSVEGDKKLRTVLTPYGNISSIICWDADFPSVVKQTGKMNADIVFNPASDWREIDPIHTHVAVFRAIENGCSWVRQTRNGLSVIADPRGKIISSMDHFATDKWINTGNVTTKKIWSLYPFIGDLFGWLAICGLIALIFLRFLKPVHNA